MPLIRLRQLLKEHFESFPRVAIIGGLVRDLARKGPTGFRSDVDLVIEAPNRDVVALAERLRAEPNRFGGFGYQHTHWKIDFWALESTWASTSGYVSVRELRDLIQCTFFDCDAVLYDLKSRVLLCSADYLDILQRREININLLPTPSIRGNLLRSIRRLLLWNVRSGPKLSNFIGEHLNAESFQAIQATEKAIYPNPILSRFSDASELAWYLFEIDERVRIDISFAIQMPLPGL
jgi:hypothetical protein